MTHDIAKEDNYSVYRRLGNKRIHHECEGGIEFFSGTTEQ